MPVDGAFHSVEKRRVIKAIKAGPHGLRVYERTCVFVQKKKTITDVLAESEPKAGRPADLQKIVTDYYSDKRSVIEKEELKLTGERGRRQPGDQTLCGVRESGLDPLANVYFLVGGRLSEV